MNSKVENLVKSESGHAEKPFACHMWSVFQHDYSVIWQVFWFAKLFNDGGIYYYCYMKIKVSSKLIWKILKKNNDEIVEVLAFAVKPLLSSFWPKIQLQWQIPKESKRYQEKSQGPMTTRFLQRFLLKTLLLRFHPQLKKILIDIKKSKLYILRGLTLVFT